MKKEVLSVFGHSTEPGQSTKRMFLRGGKTTLSRKDSGVNTFVTLTWLGAYFPNLTIDERLPFLEEPLIACLSLTLKTLFNRMIRV